MQFDINYTLLAQSRATLLSRKNLYWIVGGAGSGKTTISQALSDKLGVPVYDMDNHIYGKYHGRFTQERHPVNTAWSKSQDGLAWLLDMHWDEFINFDQAAIPEYLDLLCEDIDAMSPDIRLLVDGGICNPTILVQAFPASQIVCLAAPGRSSPEIWSETDGRKSMKEIIFQLPNPKEVWRGNIWGGEGGHYRNYLEVSGLAAGPHTIMAENLGIDGGGGDDDTAMRYFGFSSRPVQAP